MMLLAAAGIAVAFLAVQLLAERAFASALRRHATHDVFGHAWDAVIAGALNVFSAYTTVHHNQGCTPLNAHACFSSHVDAVQQWFLLVMLGYYGEFGGPAKRQHLVAYTRDISSHTHRLRAARHVSRRRYRSQDGHGGPPRGHDDADHPGV